MKHLYTGCLVALLAFSTAQAQTSGIGIGTTTPDASAALDVRSAAKGLLIPRVALASLTDATTVASPAPSLLVYNTTSLLGVGYYYNAGTAAAPQWQRLVTQAGLDATNATVSDMGTTSWRTTGNAPTATGRLGTTTNQSVDLLTNSVVRGRISSQGEFFWGTTSTAQSGDLMNAVSNSSFPFALNGYGANNGSGVYGAITGSNTTTFAAVQGENNSNTGGANTAGVRGINRSYTAGTGFRALSASGPRAGVVGGFVQPGAYSFGVHGSSPSYTTRTGAVFGDDGGICYGAMAYYSADNHDYSFYGFGNTDNITSGSPSGRLSGPAAPVVNTHIGLGVEGGVLGGWVRGQAYGLLARGERYSLYVDGAAVTNQPLTQLVALASGERVAAYAPAAATADVSARGQAELRDGQAVVAFPAGFGALLANPQEATITVTPAGDTRGVYVAEVNESGFVVRENQGGRSRAALHWTVSGLRRDAPAGKLAPELLAPGFDARQRALMRNDADPAESARNFWWDGQQVRFDAPPPKALRPVPTPGLRAQAAAASQK